MTPIPVISHELAGEIFGAWFATNPFSGRFRFRWYRREHGPDYLYFAARADLVKIGWSKDPRDRMRHLGGDSWKLIVLISDGSFTDEQILVDGLAHFRARGREWLTANRDLLRLVGQLRDAAEACLYTPSRPRKPHGPHKRHACSLCNQVGHNKATCENQITRAA